MIRAHRPTELEDLLRVWARGSEVSHSFLGRDFLEWERRMISDVYLHQAETSVWESEGNVVGFISLLGNEVGGLFVDPGSHRSGIGRALIERARSLRGALEVEVFERNALGRAFYSAMGFELVEHTVHDPTGFEVLRLRLEADDRPPPRSGTEG